MLLEKKEKHLAQNIYKEAKEKINFNSDPPHLLKWLRYAGGVWEVQLNQMWDWIDRVDIGVSFDLIS